MLLVFGYREVVLTHSFSLFTPVTCQWQGFFLSRSLVMTESRKKCVHDFFPSKPKQPWPKLKLWYFQFTCIVYTHVSCDYWRSNFEANFKGVASYMRYKISIFTAGHGYAIDQNIYPFTLAKSAAVFRVNNFEKKTDVLLNCIL